MKVTKDTEIYDHMLLRLDKPTQEKIRMIIEKAEIGRGIDHSEVLLGYDSHLVLVKADDKKHVYVFDYREVSKVRTLKLKVKQQ